MKQRIFTLIMMLALVIVTGSAFAVSTPTSPYAGATHNYKWSGIGTTNAETFLFYLTSDIAGATRLQDASKYVMSSSTTTGTFVTTDGSERFHGTATSDIDVDIAWNAAISTGTYYLWVRIDDNKSCFNQKRLTITIVANNLDFAIAELSSTASWSSSDANAIDDTTPPAECLDETTIVPGNGNSGYDPGTTVLYYKIKRLNGSSGTANTWDIDIDVTSASADYGYDIVVNDGTSDILTATTNTASTTATSHTLSNVAYNVNALLVTVTLVNDPAVTVNSLLALTLANGHEDGTNLNEPVANINALNVANHTIQSMPSIGSFTGL